MPLRGTQTVSRRSVFAVAYPSPVYCMCNVIYTCKKSKAFPALTVMKHTSIQHSYVPTYTNIHSHTLYSHILLGD